MKNLALVLIFISSTYMFGQIKIGNTPSQIDSNSLLELESNDKVFVLNKMTSAQMNAITPLEGALVYNLDEKCIFIYESISWKNLCNHGTDNQALTFDNSSNILTLENGGTIDLSNYVNTDDQVLTFDNTTNVLTLEDGGTVDLTKFLDDTNTDEQQITDFSVNGSNVLSITLENGNTQTVDLSSLNNSGTDNQALSFDTTTNVLTLEDGGTVDLTKFLDDTNTDEQEITDFSVNGSNVLSITLENGNTQTVDLSSLNNSGTDDQALSFDNSTNVLTLEDGGTVDLTKFLDDTDKQTITDFSVNGSNVLSITLENGNTQTVDLSSLNNSGTDDQALSFDTTSNVLTLEDGGTVDLSKFLDDTNTDEQQITDFSVNGSNVLSITLENGNTQTVDLSSLNNSGTDNQALSFDGATNVLTLEDGGTVDLTKFLDDTDKQTITDLSVNGSNVLSITLENGNTQTVDLSSLNNSGTDDQTLSFDTTSNVLTLEDGGTVDLSKFLDDTNTDEQTITDFSVNGSNVLSITLENGNTQTVDLSSLNNSGTDDQKMSLDGSTNVLTLEDGGTVDLTKFLDDTDKQTITDLSVNGSNVLSITLENGNTKSVDLSSYVNNDTNELISGANLTGTDLKITDAGGTTTVDLSSLKDSGTDDQALSFDGTTNVLTLEDGGTVDLTKFLDDTDKQTITDLSVNGSNVLSITLENGNTQTVDLSSLNNSGTDDQALSFDGATNVLTLEDGGTVDLTKFLDDTDEQTITDFSVNGSNVLSITLENGNTQTVDLSSLNNSGTDDQALSFDTTSNVLTLEDGGTVDLSKFLDDTTTDEQTITDFSVNGSNVLSITLENGNTQTVDLSSLNNSGTDDQTLSFDTTSNVLTLEDGGTVDLTKFLDDTNTDEQQITDFSVNGSNVLSITLENGNTQTVDLSSLNNSGTDDQALSFDGATNVLTLEDGGTVDLTKFLDDTDEQTITDFSVNGSNVLSITLENGNTQTVDLSSLNNSGTDDQALSFDTTSNVLTLEDGGTVDLSKFLDDTNTDEQTITDFSVNGSNVLSITLENGNTQTVDLSSLNNSGTDDQALSFDTTTNVLTLEDGGIVDLTKFLDDTNTDEQQITDFSVNGSNVLSITLENGNTQTVDLSSLNNSGTDDQTLSFDTTSNVLTLEDGGTVDLTKFLDDTNTDEQQITDFSVNGSNVLSITLENGNTQTVDLSSLNNSGTDDQALSFDGATNVLTLEDGGTVDLTKFLDDTDEQTITDFSVNGSNVLSITLENGNTQTVDLSSLNNSGTDDQTLSFDTTSNVLTLEDGGTVDLTKFLDDTNTDEQEITDFSVNGSNVLSITLENGNTQTVDLSSLNNSGTDDQTLSFDTTSNVLTLEDGGIVDLTKFLDDTNTDEQEITDFSVNGSNVLSITLENGNTQTVDLSSLNNSGTDDQALSFDTISNVLTLEDGGTVDLTKFLDDTNTDEQTITDFSVNGSNVLSITLENGNTQTVDLSSLNNSGTDDQALSFDNTTNVLTLENGGTVDLTKFLDDTNTDEQEITDFSVNGSNVLSITLENGNTQTVDLSSLNNSGTDDQALSFDTTSNVLTLEDGGTVDLTKFLDDTDKQTITDLSVNGSNVLSITLENGNTKSVDLSSYVNNDTNELISGANLTGTDLKITDAGGTTTVDLSSLKDSGTDDQKMSLDGSTNKLTLEDGGYVNLSKFLDDTDEQKITDFSVNGANKLSITLENGNTKTVDLSSLNNSGTDDQALSFDNSTNVLTLEDGGTVDLTKFLDDTNTDEQEITDFSVNGSNVLSITLENGNTQTVDLSSYINNDTNELQSLSQTGTNVTLSNGGGTISVADNDNNSSNELQSLSQSGSNVTLSNGGGTITVNDADSDSTNEIQTLSQSGNDVTLSNTGGTISFTKETIGYIFAALHHSGGNGNGAILYQINNSVTGPNKTTRTNVGRYSVRFNTPHPNGNNYPISLGVRVNGNRDGRIIQVVDGTQNANGFNVIILTGDNGTAADPYVDSHWYFNVSATKEVITNITVN